MVDLAASHEEDEEGLSLRSLSVILEQKCVEKCVETLVRLDSINVELVEDELEFIRHVIDFSIDYATNDGINTGKLGSLKRRLAHMLNIDEKDERFKVAMDMLNTLLDGVATDTDADLRQNENVHGFDDSYKLSDGYEQLYDASDPKKLHIPPVWTPSDRSANAALIYLYFRTV